MKFSARLVFTILWSVVVYDPMAHMVRVKGGLLNASLGGRFPTLDFAGGTVVHLTSGVSALVCALYLGKRVGYPKEQTAPHGVVLSFIGACMLWVGWFGVNAGSAFAAGSLAAWRPALLWQPNSQPRPQPWDGRERSGLATASRAYWGESPELWRAWWQSRQRLVLCSRWLPWPSV